MLVTEQEYKDIQKYRTLNRRCDYCKYYYYRNIELCHIERCIAKKIKLGILDKSKKCELYSVDMSEYHINKVFDELHTGFKSILMSHKQRS